MFTSLTHYSPTKTADDEGGYTSALGTGTTMYGAIRVHAGETQLILPTEESINMEDIVLTDGQYYRVLSRLGHTAGPYQAYRVEATQKPVEP